MDKTRKLLTLENYPKPKRLAYRDSYYVEISIPRPIRHLFGKSSTKRKVAGPNIEDYERKMWPLANEIYAQFDKAQAQEIEDEKRGELAELNKDTFSIAQHLLRMMNTFPVILPEGKSVFKTVIKNETRLNIPGDTMPFYDLKDLKRHMDFTANTVRRDPTRYNNLEKAYSRRYLSPDIENYWRDLLVGSARNFKKPEPKFEPLKNKDFWPRHPQGGLMSRTPLQLNKRKRMTTSHTLTSVRDDFVKHVNAKKDYEWAGKCRLAIDEFIELMGDLEPSTIDRRMARNFVSRGLEKAPTRSQSTIGSRLSGMNAFTDWAWEVGLMDESSPFKGHEKAKQQGKKAKNWEPYSEEDLIVLFNYNWQPQERLLLAMGLVTGCRINEIGSLTWERVITDNTSMTYITYIPDANADDPYRIKNSASKREVPIHPALKIPPGTTGRLFDYPFAKTGRCTTSAGDSVLPMMRETFFPNQRYHSLRYTLRQMMTEVDTPLDIKDFITGHRSGNVGQDTYDKASREKKLEWLSKIDLSKLNLNG